MPDKICPVTLEQRQAFCQVYRKGYCKEGVFDGNCPYRPLTKHTCKCGAKFLPGKNNWVLCPDCSAKGVKTRIDKYGTIISTPTKNNGIILK